MKIYPFLLIIISISIFSFCDNSSKQDTTIPTSKSEPTLETMIGQMIMVGTRGYTIEEVTPKFREQMNKGYVGGIILFDYDVIKKGFDRNIRSPQQVKQFTSDLQNQSPTPLFMAIDQEGGKVNRLKSKYGFPKSVTAKYLGNLDNVDSTRHYANLTAQTLEEMGFNVNFAPDADVDLNPANPVIGKYERSFSKNPELVIKHGKIFVEAQKTKGIISTLKHFPGHGSSDSDSHEGVTDITKYWTAAELIPFQKIIEADNSVAIMTAHVVNDSLDTEFPATLSKKIITGILRKQMNFDGLIFSDDMQMKAVNAIFDFETILKNSINAGVDVLVFGNNQQYDELIPEKAVKAIVGMVEKGDVSRERIEQSYARIKKAKASVTNN